MRNFELVAENEFSKTFKSEDIEVYLAKAYDEEAQSHYLIASIPFIPEAKVEAITYPMPFPNEQERDSLFSAFNTQDCSDMIDTLIGFMKEQTEYLNEEQKKIDAGETVDTEYEETKPESETKIQKNDQT